MQSLRPATLLDTFISFFLPKRLEVEIRTSNLEDGDSVVQPVFLIDGMEVAAKHIHLDARQRVLGRYVELGDQAKKVLELTKGKPIQIAKSKAARLLGDLANAGVRVCSGDGKRAVVLKTAKPDVSLKLTPTDSLVVKSKLVTPEGKVIGKPKDIAALRIDDGWHVDGDDLVQVDLTQTPLDKMLVQESGSGTLEGGDVPRFLKLLARHASHVGSVEKDETLSGLSVESSTASFRANVKGTEDHITVEPHLTLTTSSGSSYSYSEAELPALQQAPGGFARVQQGWLEVEPSAVPRFNEARKSLSELTGGERPVTGTDIPKVLSALNGTKEDRAANRSPWNVYYSKAVADSHRLCDELSSLEFRLNIVESDGKALLQLDPVYSHARFTLNHSEVENAASTGAEWVRRPHTWVHVDEDRFHRVSGQALALRLKRSGDGFAFPAADRERVLEVFSTLGTIRQSEAYGEFLARLHDFERIETVPLPNALRSDVTLRPYQQHGFNWLAFLQKFSLNGILADDMGLGKTLQTLTAIERAREQSGSQLPSLIICPTSVMLNWRNEIHKFLSHARVVVYHGAARQNHTQVIRGFAATPSRSRGGAYVITSYDTARIDCDELNRIPWLYVVVDEGHNIKNPDAQRTRAIKTIAGQHKLALTGTPIQNKLEELWSLFDFAMPGYLGQRAVFRRTYATNNRVDWSAVQHRLVPRIRPFVLRRLKKHVAQDLPDKIIVDSRVELTPEQVRLYKAAIQSTEYHKLVDELDSKGVARAQAQILAVLTKLRNICNHPVLLKERWSPSDAAVEASGKLDQLQELMEEIVEGDHRALLFSQSTRVLDIIEHYFSEWGVRSLRIDGSTAATARARLADEFNANDEISCFLLSTKAAGVGLNLVGADTVIFYDHDWNPANDNQAMDRAYRIGQTRNVTVYRLISKGTIEEKILQRQQIKQTLADDVIGSDAQGFKDLSKEELLDLFRLDL